MSVTFILTYDKVKFLLILKRISYEFLSALLSFNHWTIPLNQLCKRRIWTLNFIKDIPMKLKIIALLGCTSLSLFTASASANILTDGRCQLSQYTLDCSHWYASANIGVSHLHDNPIPNSRNSVAENGPGWNVDAGYQFDSMFGAEIGYTDYYNSQEMSSTTVIAQTEHYVVDLAGTMRYPLICKFNALGKLGLAYGSANKIVTTTGVSGTTSAVSLYGGLGVTYSVTPRVDLVALWAGAHGNSYTGSNELYSLGMTFAIA